MSLASNYRIDNKKYKILIFQDYMTSQIKYLWIDMNLIYIYLFESSFTYALWSICLLIAIKNEGLFDYSSKYF